MKTLLVPLIGQHDLENPLKVERLALDAGFDLARRFDAHVKVVSLIDRPPVSSKKWPIWWPGGGAGELLDWIDEVSEQRRKHAVAQYNAVVSAQDPQPLQTDSPAPGFTAHFTEQIGEVVEMLGPICRLADLIVASAADTNWMGPFSPLVEEMLRDAGKPLLIVPKGGTKAVGETVAIAWDGSAASARAASSAMPFLRQAREIIVFSCDEGKDDAADPADMVEYLEWHGLEAGSSHVKHGEQRPGSAIIDAALERNPSVPISVRQPSG